MTKMSSSPEPLRKLFHPGNGVAPPHMAGRGAIQRELRNLSLSLEEGGQVDEDCVLFGPRGCGKTVLLRAFERNLLSSVSDARAIDLVSATPDDIPDVASLASLLLAGEEAADIVSKAPGLNALYRLDEGGIGRSFAHLNVKRLPDAEISARLKTYLRKRVLERPLAVVLDEAHVLDLAVGKHLLNLSQDLRSRGLPFALVMAGTPGLESHLGQMGATFWERSAVHAVGRFTVEAARDAFARPLKSRGVQVDSDALDVAVERSQQYPYFVQLWGQALCLCLEAASDDRVTVATVRNAEEHVQKKQAHFYRRRCGEIERVELFEAALLVGAAFVDEESSPDARHGSPHVPRHLLQRQLEAELSMSAGQGLSTLDKLIELGYIWEPEGHGAVAPGIPTLMSHMAAEGIRRRTANS